MTTRINTELSDLFFNHQHDEYDSLFGKSKEGPTHEEMEQAILKDATAFVEYYPTFSQGYTANELASDFMARL